jgi:hypothetical protein
MPKLNILKFIVPIFLMSLVGCVSKAPPEPFYTRIFEGSYDDVWLATLKALNDYPLKVSNKDAGKIQSEVVNGPYNDLLFTYPEAIELPERFRYALKFNFAKLVADNKSPMIRIRIIKDLEQFQDFYTGWIPYASDGLEERLLLYRIEHILKMEKTLAGTPNQ